MGTDQNSKLTYFGVLRAPTSWAKVGRHLASALITLGCDVNLFERKGFLYDPTFRLPDPIEAKIVESPNAQMFRDDAVFTFEHPGAYGYLQGRIKIGLLTYESTVVPPHWVEGVNRYLDLLLVPSSFCFEIFEKGGVAKERMAVLPYGFDPDVYYPDIGKEKSNTESGTRRFLTVACPHKREGIEKVLNAYRSAFSKADDVSLTIKVSYMPGKKTKPFEYTELAATIRRFSEDANSPEIELLSDYLSAPKLADLYRNASCLVSATRGEGFGMVFLEAAACGLPVIVTGWSGHMDFVRNADARLVRYNLRPAGEMQYDCQSKESLLADPDVDDLSQKMREAYEQPSSGNAAINRDWLLRYTWLSLAAQFLEILEKRLGFI